MYINCHTYYSLRFGTFSEVDLLKLARQNGCSSIVLTDINNTSACLNFIRRAQEFQIRPIVGIDFRNGVDQQFIGIAKNNQGFHNLNQFLSEHSHENKAFPPLAPSIPESFIIYPFEKVLQLNKTIFGKDEFIGVSLDDLRKLPFSKLKNQRINLVIQQPVTFRTKRDFNAHRLLRAIGLNTLLSKLPKSEQAKESERMVPLEELLNAFQDFPEIIDNTQNILDQCSITFSFGKTRTSQNQQTFGKSKEEDFKTLKNLCEKGFSKRYRDPTPLIRNRLKVELETIQKMDFVSYFLINHDIVLYAKRNGYPHVGRGSGANSIVAYIIGITDVDPIELDLYFERFINPYRASPPDFDIDFSWKERDDVTRYIFERYSNVALLATYNTFKYRAVVRELGKVFGLPKEEIDKLSSGHYSKTNLDEISSLVLKYGELIRGFPNYLSVHSAGILILENPIHYYSATDLPPKNFPTVQFDMIIAEDVGIFKFDILGQRGLAKIKDALEIIKQNRPEVPQIDINDVVQFKNDDKINSLLAKGKAIGAYYVESPAMRGLMQKLQVKDYLGLVAASSVIRPGVSSSGMKNEYIKRHRNPNLRKLANPILNKIMPETYGIMVYQEDVLKVANQFAGLTLGEADVLRRGMSGKFRSREEFLAVEKKFLLNCREKGYSEKLTTEVWEQIKSFAGYAFAKGHSASYAVESYQSLFLKCYYPLEFMVAVLNNGGGFYSAEHYIHEAKMQGGTIHPPCINNSDHPTCIKEAHIFLGFGYLKNLESLTIARFLTERQLNGSYRSLDDFIDRVPISIEQLTILIRIDAFRFTGNPKTELMWQAIFKLNAYRSTTRQPLLFKPMHKKFVLPKLNTGWLENAYDQMELLGFHLFDHFKIIDEELKSTLRKKDFNKYNGAKILIYGVLVNTRFHTTSAGKKIRFCTFTDLDGEYFDTVHFTKVVDKYPIHGRGVYSCYGKVSEEFGFYSLDIIWSIKISIKPDPRSPDNATHKINTTSNRKSSDFFLQNKLAKL